MRHFISDFKKTKVAFALALLGTLFTLHPLVSNPVYRNATSIPYEVGGVQAELDIFHAYLLMMGLFALTVWCYSVAFMSERPFSWVEALGNTLYALAVMVVPFSALLYLASFLAEALKKSHPDWYHHLYWVVPVVALILVLPLALYLRRKLGEQDFSAKHAQLVGEEIGALKQAKELFDHHHYDLSVIEAWKALDARLNRLLAARGITVPVDNPRAMLDRARKKGILRENTWRKVQELRKHWNVAVSHEPLGRSEAQAALEAARDIMASIPVHEVAEEEKLTV
jgi:HEPN domain-containing protein